MAKISLSELENYLWGAANILRGPVDKADFKSYIFPLLFFKRISDVYDEEYQTALEESGGDKEYASFPEHHAFIIPEGHGWNNIREKTENVGQALLVAFREIEKANPDQLFGIFGDTNWSNKDRLSDELLIDLIEHFSSKSLSKNNVEPDILGQAYEFLIKKFADLTNKKAGEFYTPRSVIHLLGGILKPKEKDRIYDPACGSGGMLLEAVEYVKNHCGDSRQLRLFGQEKNLTTSTIARMNMFLHDIEDFRIVRDDTLRNPAFKEGDYLAQFDVVIANPPFSLDSWGADMWINDPFRRNIAGTPPKSNGDFAWIQHMITSMSDFGGRMGIVLPHGVLFRQGVEGKIRQKLLEDDKLEAVIGLGPNLFYGTNISACILLFKAEKETDKKNKIYFIDGSEQFKKGRNQNFFLEEHKNLILEWYEAYEEIENISRVVELDEIAKNNYNLNISRYIKKVNNVEEIDLKQSLEELQQVQEEYYEAEKEMKEKLKEIGIEL